MKIELINMKTAFYVKIVIESSKLVRSCLEIVENSAGCEREPAVPFLSPSPPKKYSDAVDISGEAVET